MWKHDAYVIRREMRRVVLKVHFLDSVLKAEGKPYLKQGSDFTEKWFIEQKQKSQQVNPIKNKFILLLVASRNGSSSVGFLDLRPPTEEQFYSVSFVALSRSQTATSIALL